VVKFVKGRSLIGLVREVKGRVDLKGKSIEGKQEESQRDGLTHPPSKKKGIVNLEKPKK